MRAGLGAAGRAVEAQVDGESVKRRLISTVAVMTRQAGMMAHQVCVHDGREEVTKDDVNAALMHQARHFLLTVDSDPVVAQIVQMEREIFGDSSEESEGSTASSDDDDAESSEDAVDSPVPSTRVAPNGPCVCAECESVRAAVDTWPSWNPSDDAERYLRDSVNKAIAAATARTSPASSAS